MEFTKYKNGTYAKLKNRRVFVSLNEKDDNVHIQYTKLTNKGDAQKPSAKHKIVGDKIKLTSINLSIEAAEATLISLCIELGYDINSVTKI